MTLTEEAMTFSSAEIHDAGERVADWLHKRVIADATGSSVHLIQTHPAGTFWLGRIASQEASSEAARSGREERLDPCAIGIKFIPAGDGPWRFEVVAQFCMWMKDAGSGDWRKSPRITQVLSLEVKLDKLPMSAGESLFAAAIKSATGVDHLLARVDIEQGTVADGRQELLLSLVNCSPKSPNKLIDMNFYECSLEIRDCAREPYHLEALPDSFRYDRTLPAYGINCGVVSGVDGRLETIDDPTARRYRSRFWPTSIPEQPFLFEALAADPFPLAQHLIESLRDWGKVNWGEACLVDRRNKENWSDSMLSQARSEGEKFWAEHARLEDGLDALKKQPKLLAAFKFMNEALLLSARGKYDSWRPFQFGFLLANLADLVGTVEQRGIADVVWFATGGGKTETYLGLLVTAAFLDRLTGKTHGMTAWSRFPLRMLSLQQTQRFANALAAAELVRQRHGLGGDCFSLGFFVGSGATPNSIGAEPRGDDPDPDDETMPERFRLLDYCPFCRLNSIKMSFDHLTWRLLHRCLNPECLWKNGGLPFYVVDDEIYRFLPTIVVGTLDKAANIGMQASMRGFVGAPLGYCSADGHGHVYAKRSSKPNGCLVPGCKASIASLPQNPERYGPAFRLQDELHLLRDSLGAVDSHYEALMDHLQGEIGSSKAKILASSATLAGYEKQVDVLYQRSARVFPQPSPRAGDGFWSSDTNQLMRKIVALAPRGVTAEHAIDRILTVLQRSIRQLQDDPIAVCAEIGIAAGLAAEMLSLYGTDVVYGNTLRDLDAVERSIDGQQIRVQGTINTASLTGRTDFELVRKTLNRLEKPEADFNERVHIVTASSMMSHGVDIDRLNIMVMVGLPLGTAEFIQTTARVGRTWPGLVFVLHKIGRERDAAVYRAFDKFVSHGDRFVEPIPITRKSRRVLERSLPGLVNARLLHVIEPAFGESLTTVAKMQKARKAGAIDLDREKQTVAGSLEIKGPLDEPLAEELDNWFSRYDHMLNNPPPDVRFSSKLYPGLVGPMRSLRDVEEPVPVYGKVDE